MTPPVFAGLYAEYYDDMYEDKDYAGEVDYLEGLWEGAGSRPDTVLDIGCGTGGHALELADRGYTVTGVDRSEDMIVRASRKADRAGVSDRVQFQQGDVTDLKLDGPFDAAIGMFAVMGYLTETVDVRTALSSVAACLRPGASFVFDTWYGPAVLKEGPEPRFRRIDVDDGVLYRFAKPSVDTLRQVVHVEYDLVHVDEDGRATPGRETHEMRFFFSQEMMLLADTAGLELADAQPFREPDGELGTGTWNVTWTLKKPIE